MLRAGITTCRKIVNMVTEAILSLVIPLMFRFSMPKVAWPRSIEWAESHQRNEFSSMIPHADTQRIDSEYGTLYDIQRTVVLLSILQDVWRNEITPSGSVKRRSKTS